MIFAPAKINLGLKLTGRYSDGYHRLESIFLPVSLFDRMSVMPAQADEVRHVWPSGISDESRQQLAVGAIANPLLKRTLQFIRNLCSERFGFKMPPYCVIVEKQIPSPSGLGGASSDAAALILHLVERFAKAGALPEASLATQLPSEWILLSAKLGADVPYFLEYGLKGKAALLDGIGHELQEVALPNMCGWICVPDFGFSTAAMFAEVRRLPLPLAQHSDTATPREPAPNLSLRLIEIPYSDNLTDGVRRVQNDFDSVAAVVFPSESLILQKAMATIAVTIRQFFPIEWGVGMTGSGAALYAATDTKIPRVQLASRSHVLKARLGQGWQVYPYQGLLRE